MGHKIFISYKYGDTSVKHLERTPWYESTKVRHYVDELRDKICLLYTSPIPRYPKTSRMTYSA